VLNDGLRTSDRAFRIGGDEFALLLVSTHAEAAEDAVARLKVALGGADGGDAPLSASFGTAIYPADGATATELVRTADERLYAAKRTR
jgi:diguanylate cyclase (GGDEF)-like protein